jgi:hypothetical protein
MRHWFLLNCPAAPLLGAGHHMVIRNFRICCGTALIFCFIFSFKLPYLYNSAALASAVSFVHVFCQPATLVQLRRIFFNKLYLWLNALVVCFFVYSALITVVHGEYDFSFLSLFVSYGFYMLSGPVVLTAVHSIYRLEASDAIINAFTVQSVIIIVAFFVPGFRDALRIFKDETQLEIADGYFGGGLRGLALAGGLFFSLSCGYCLYFFLVARRFIEKRLSMPGLAAVLVSMFSAVTAGRTSLLGMALAGGLVMAFFVLRVNRELLAANLKRLGLLVVCIVAFVLVAVPQKYLDTAFESYAKFSFEMVFNLLEGKGFTTSSTDRLNEMYFPLEVGEVLNGDGRYSSVGGGYYRQTDAGYMRNILLGGLPAVFLAMMHLAIWFFAMARYSKEGVLTRRADRLFLVAVALMILLLHYKGEALVYVVMINNILYLMLFERVLARPATFPSPDDGRFQSGAARLLA